jgi:hypothetical protein
MHCNTTYLAEPQAHAVKVNIPDETGSFLIAHSMQKLSPAMASVDVQVSTPVVTPVPAKEKGSLLPRLMDWAGGTNMWGWLPELALYQSAVLMFLAWAFVRARAGLGSSEFLLWVSLTALIFPSAFRLAMAQPVRRERIGLILLLGMSLYLVKVMHSPVAFTFPDELSHLRNVNELLRTFHLFQENPILPVTSFYPGLPTVTGTLASLSGLSTFSSGILVLGIARLILFLSLFLLYEHVSGSARVAGLATLLYMANPNFLYWTAEYAYEPLALPFLVLVLLAVAKREMADDRRHYIAWTVVALSGLFTVIITHHMSSYILTGLLTVLVVFYAVRSRGKQWGPWDIAIIAVVATTSWLIWIASFTIEYLAPVLGGAVQSIFHLVAEEEKSRVLFTSGSTGRSAPLWEQAVAIGSVVLIAMGLPFGVYEIWEKYRTKIFALLLALIALVYLPMQMLRFSKAGWETANRSSEFLFIGIGFVLALGIVNLGLSRWSDWRGQTILAGLAVVLFLGGFIAGWPPRARLPHAYMVSAGDHQVQPQAVSVAEWMLANLGPNNRIAASKADAKLLGAYSQYPFTDTASSIRTMFLSEDVGPAEIHTLSKRDIQYVLTDRKMISWDHMIGYYFYNEKSLSYLAPRAFKKFDRLEGVTRMLDAGDIVVYDVERYLSAYDEQSQTTSTNVRVP